MGELREGEIVGYGHPDWGASSGRVLRTDGGAGREILVQDLHPVGAREWIDRRWLTQQDAVAGEVARA